MKTLVCDASSLISLSEVCLLCMLEKFAGKVQIIVPPGVKKEIVDNPLHSKKYGFKAYQLNNYIEDGLIHVYPEDVKKETSLILHHANNFLEYKNQPIKLIHMGEAQALACLNQTMEKTFLVDERTTRLLIEDPLKVQEHMEHTTKKKVIVDHRALEKFQELTRGIKIIRSAELAVYAYEQNWLNHRASEKTLSDLLYALKFAGCSITNEEIERYTEMLG